MCERKSKWPSITSGFWVDRAHCALCVRVSVTVSIGLSLSGCRLFVFSSFCPYPYFLLCPFLLSIPVSAYQSVFFIVTFFHTIKRYTTNLACMPRIYDGRNAKCEPMKNAHVKTMESYVQTRGSMTNGQTKNLRAR